MLTNALILYNFVCAAQPQTAQPVLLRSYNTSSGGEENYACSIWEAARATSGSPLFFAPREFKISGVTFVDGSMRLNNPISAVLNEADTLFPDTEPTSIISLGTGWADIDSNYEAQAFENGNRGTDFSENGIYFRLDVERGLETISLGEWTKFDDIDASTDAYLARADKRLEIKKCAESLNRRGGSRYLV